MKLQDYCKQGRLTLGMTQREYARLVGTNQTEISYIERGFIPESNRKKKQIIKIYNAVKPFKKRRWKNDRSEEKSKQKIQKEMQTFIVGILFDGR